MAAFQNVSCFVFEQSVVFHNPAVQNKQLGIGFIVDALFGNFAYLKSLYTVVELHTNLV